MSGRILRCRKGYWKLRFLPSQLPAVFSSQSLQPGPAYWLAGSRTTTTFPFL
jgi:hypothetical protein